MLKRIHLTKVAVAKQHILRLLKHVLKRFVKLQQQCNIINVIKDSYVKSVLKLHKLKNLKLSVFPATFCFT